MIDRLSVQKAASILGYSIRLFRKWCSLNNVGILTDHGIRKQYVLVFEFEQALNASAYVYIFSKYRKDRTKIVDADYTSAASQIRSIFNQGKAKETSHYEPKGEHEKIFLSRLTAKLSEL